MHLSPFLRNFIAIYGTLLGGSIIRYAYIIVLARMLGPVQFGLFAYSVAFYGALFVIANFGQHALLSTRIKGRRSRISIPAAYSLTITSVSTCISVMAGLTFVWIIEEGLTLSIILTIMLGAMVARNFVAFIRYCAIAAEEASWLPRYEITFRGGEAAIGVMSLLAGAGLLTVCVVHLLGWVFESVFAFYRMHRQSGLTLHFGVKRKYLLSVARRSLIFTISYGFFHLFTLIGILMIRFWQTDAIMVGNFAIAMQLFSGAAMLPVAFGSATTPAIGRIGGRSNIREMKSLETVVKGAIVAGGFTAILAEAYGPWLIEVIFGTHFVMAGSSFALICWGLGPYAVAIILGYALNALDGHKEAAVSAAFMIIVYAFIFLLFAVYDVIFAASLSLIVGAIVGCVATVWFISERIESFGMKWWFRPFLVVVLIGILMRLQPLPNEFAAPFYIGLLSFIIWRCRFFTKQEFKLFRKNV